MGSARVGFSCLLVPLHYVYLLAIKSTHDGLGDLLDSQCRSKWLSMEKMGMPVNLTCNWQGEKINNISPKKCAIGSLSRFACHRVLSECVSTANMQQTDGSVHRLSVHVRTSEHWIIGTRYVVELNNTTKNTCIYRDNATDGPKHIRNVDREA